MVAMHLPRLYVNACLSRGQSVELDQQYSSRLSRVMRMRCGQGLYVFGNDGKEYRAKIARMQRHAVHIDVGEHVDGHQESSLSLTLALAVVRPAAVDIALQKAVEMGVQNCVLLYTEYSQHRHDTKAKYRHWQKLIINATEQCRRVRLCALHPPQPFADWMARQQDDGATRLILDPGAPGATPPSLLDIRAVTLLVGPEGGFAERELALARDSGCIGFSLGPRILRTETAALCAIAVCQAWYGDCFS